MKPEDLKDTKALDNANKKIKITTKTQKESIPKNSTTHKNSKDEQIPSNILNKVFNELISKKSALEEEIINLEIKNEALKKDIDSTFIGQSDNIAKQVKGFQDYLSGALENLSHSVERMELVSQPIIVKPSPLDKAQNTSSNDPSKNLPALADTFKPDEKIIRQCFSNFCNQPDFYADPWKLRRSLNHEDIEILDDWFFNMGGRGAIESRGSRQKNILLSAGLISILGELYGDQFQTLILASEPERLGEWRRILQDSLGLSREDFGPSSGIVLFERPEAVIERADRLEENNEVPFILIDAAETSVEIPILQFPLWLAFAGTDEEIYGDL